MWMVKSEWGDGFEGADIRWILFIYYYNLGVDVVMKELLIGLFYISVYSEKWGNRYSIDGRLD